MGVFERFFDGLFDRFKKASQERKEKRFRKESMYINKWWGQRCLGTSHDARILIKYFYLEDKVNYTMEEILKDLYLDSVLGKEPLSEIQGYYYIDDEQKHREVFANTIEAVASLSLLLLQCLVGGSVVAGCFEAQGDIEFLISASKEEIGLLISELEKAAQVPSLDLEMRDEIIEICNELKVYG